MAETRKVFHKALEQLNDDVIHLAALAADAIDRGTEVFVADDMSGVNEVIEKDRLLDDLTCSIEDRAYLLLARQQPMAVDLRTLVTMMRVIHDLERIGDLMINISKARRRIFPHKLDPKVVEVIQRMREQALTQLSVAVQAFSERDPSQAAALDDMDDAMDELQKDLLRHVFAYKSDEESVRIAVQLALVGRYFERIADHAVNFGERVEFMVTGHSPSDSHKA